MASKAKTYEPDADYEVRVSRVLTYKASKLRPMHTYTIKGRVLNELPADAIVSATPV